MSCSSPYCCHTPRVYQCLCALARYSCIESSKHDMVRTTWVYMPDSTGTHIIASMVSSRPVFSSIWRAWKGEDMSRFIARTMMY